MQTAGGGGGALRPRYLDPQLKIFRKFKDRGRKIPRSFFLGRGPAAAAHFFT